MRPLVRADGISRSYGPTHVLQDASFHVFEGDKIALVGPNGAGKTTLFQLLAGELQADMGTFETQPGLRVAYLPQIPEAPEDTLVTELLAAPTREAERLAEQVAELEAWMAEPGAWEQPDAQDKMARYTELQEALAEEKAKGTVTSTPLMEAVGLHEHLLEARWGELSGGERSKVSLCKFLATGKEADLLLLDEPTNHMDIPTVEFIEDYLMNLEGAVVVAAHDRYLLDNVATRVFELGNRQVKCYTGNFSSYLAQKEAIRKALEARRKREYEEFKRQKAIIEELKRRNKYDAQVQSRQKRMKRAYDELPRPSRSRDRGFKLVFETPRVPHRMITAEGVAKGFEGRTLFQGVDLEIPGGAKVGIIGPNGAGKTTLLRLITGQLAPDDGTVEVSKAAEIGYFDQHHATLEDDRTLLDEMRTLRTPAPPDEWTRGLLGRFGFSGDTVFKQVGDLSGGERARLSLAKFVADRYNLLVLDEPTNHLDLEGQEIVAQALGAYEGTVLVVSHNRSFLDQVCTHIMVLDHQRVGLFTGNFTTARTSKQMATFTGAEVDVTYRVLAAFEDTARGKRYQKGDRIELNGLETQDFRRLVRQAEADGMIERV
ncbi:MAG: ABC-F family ATP-binding cassette domain-containing protein [Candidatus Thermoplasmatota archaeon]|nr:ABC-F family ATP-binding cassette domain-containing protein [Candidatus Thermoplasmatota archaeon]